MNINNPFHVQWMPELIRHHKLGKEATYFVKILLCENGTEMVTSCGSSEQVISYMASRGRCCTHQRSYFP